VPRKGFRGGPVADGRRRSSVFGPAARAVADGCQRVPTAPRVGDTAATRYVSVGVPLAPDVHTATAESGRSVGIGGRDGCDRRWNQDTAHANKAASAIVTRLLISSCGRPRAQSSQSTATYDSDIRPRKRAV
jgi:hypothetical protein